jgi:N-dimethylarginine dimethylaminohydrolase
MRFLMCAPTFFGVEYSINPWMEGNKGKASGDAAQTQWNDLHALLTETLGATVELVEPRPGLPDMVFTANAGLVRDNLCMPSRFRPVERRGEEPYYRAWFAENGFDLREIPDGTLYEGAGDALFEESETAGGPLLWAAYGIRTTRDSHPALAEIFGAEIVALRLVDERFYHLDTCFCPLPGGFLLWYPPAFDEVSRAVVESRIPAEKRYAIGDEDAAAFACNAVAVGSRAIVLNAATEELRNWLLERGFTTYATPLTEFMKAGGSAKCLTLRLS